MLAVGGRRGARQARNLTIAKVQSKEKSDDRDDGKARARHKHHKCWGGAGS